MCDRETCQREAMSRILRPGDIYPYFQAYNDCDSNKVDWRARALQAEERISALRARAESGISDRHVDGGRAVTRFVPTLETVPTEVLSAIADGLRMTADRVPILTACRLLVHAEEIAVEAIRLAAMDAGERR